MKTDDLTPQQVVAWMRSQARHFNEMAEHLESTFRLNGPATTPKSNTRVGSIDTIATAESIAEILGDGKARRSQQIADELGVDEHIVSITLSKQPDSFKRNKRGWITLPG